MLKYLFTAEYEDGSIYKQNAEDRSVKEPDKRSCYYDIDHEKVIGFVLSGEGHTYGVDLRDGHFEVDGIPFIMHEDHVKDLGQGKVSQMQLSGFRLVFFRQHRHHFDAKTGEEVGHEMTYNFGWQCTVDGKNYQRVMKIG